MFIPCDLLDADFIYSKTSIMMILQGKCYQVINTAYGSTITSRQTHDNQGNLS